MLSYQKEGKKIMTEKIDRHEAMCVKIDDFHSDYELCYILVRMLYSSSLSLSPLFLDYWENILFLPQYLVHFLFDQIIGVAFRVNSSVSKFDFYTKTENELSNFYLFCGSHNSI